jgi:hypothetical protein
LVLVAPLALVLERIVSERIVASFELLLPLSHGRVKIKKHTSRIGRV